MTTTRKSSSQNIRANKSKLKTEASFKEKFKKIFSGHLEIVIWAVVGLGGLITFFLSPLKDITYHFLYKEKAQIELFTENSRTFLGDSLRINIHVLPISKIDISEGTCEISFDEEYLRLVKGAKSLNFESIKGPKFIIDNYKTKFLTLKSGNSYIKATLRTRYNIYVDSLEVNILPMSKTEKPTIFDFSGNWKLKMGVEDGQMNLKDNDRSISGTYSFANGEYGVISGLRDGSVFIVDLIRKGELIKWNIQANWKADDQYIQIQGRSFKYIIKNSSWIRSDTSSYLFYSMVVLN